MKRILLMVMCFVVLSMGVCSAEIRKSEVDSFDGTLNINSLNFDVGSVQQFNFYKEISSVDVNYSFYIRKDCSYDFQSGYALDEFKIKIDNNNFNAKILKQNTKVNSYNFGFAHGNIRVTIEISKLIASAIKESSKVIIRLSFTDGTKDTIEIPDEVLNEWKELINMDK